MTRASDDAPDAELRAWLDELGRVSPPPDGEALESIWRAVDAQTSAADAAPMFWWRSRPTRVRRAIGATGTALVIATGGLLALRSDFAQLPVIPTALVLGALLFLLGVALNDTLRPLHQPMTSWTHGAVTAATLSATFLIAWLWPADVAETALSGPTAHLPCFFFGIAAGVPVYLLLRWLDRGPSNSVLTAACAAGLSANLVLQLHCPVDNTDHLLLGHFGAVAFIVLALGAARMLRRANNIKSAPR